MPGADSLGTEKVPVIQWNLGFSEKLKCGVTEFFQCGDLSCFHPLKET